ncbi:MBL fold metallo-hydrolase [Flavobacterium sp. DG1-102-2]|uniref:MBL fold metallo-hydrolase n=1 Tax=Flavobacterium sp. DG1-102-2 TaxID=3081663 RepID=UPI0029493F3F|nr:MBL fold metallo-hydrolase [Flavobacterium sp. DG1-102-2]MDV6167625.1 MBL fold metallo-hydrolase [Flavobacterium sp. DG1-102-2]
MKKRFKKIIMIVAVVLLIMAVGIWTFMQTPKFGSQPKGERLKKIEQAANYKDGQFQNQHHTPDLAEGVSMLTVLNKFFFGKSKRSKPAQPLPSQKIDLLHLDPSENVIVWFGHSSYFIQANGKTMLVDPVFSGAASPVSFTTRAFAGADVYAVEDLPAIDFLFISHDHWDHLDYETVLKLKDKVKKIITGLGTGQHFERWEFDMATVEERNWNETIDLGSGFVIHTTPARHFSGRGLKRNGALWTSFVVKTPTLNLYLGGDSGYDTHYKEIGDQYGPFDLAILECGQYNEYWKYIHMMPEQVVTAAQELKAKKLMPVHWAKFSLALHDWDEPILRVTAEAKKQAMPIMTPMIGQKASLTNDEVFTEWWKGLE